VAKGTRSDPRPGSSSSRQRKALTAGAGDQGSRQRPTTPRTVSSKCPWLEIPNLSACLGYRPQPCQTRRALMRETPDCRVRVRTLQRLVGRLRSTPDQRQLGVSARGDCRRFWDSLRASQPPPEKAASSQDRRARRPGLLGTGRIGGPLVARNEELNDSLYPVLSVASNRPFGISREGSFNGNLRARRPGACAWSLRWRYYFKGRQRTRGA